MRKRIVLWFLLLSTAATHCLIAQPAFFRKDIPTGADPQAVAAGDFNGDGQPDLAVSTEQGLFAMLNLGHATFASPIVAGAAWTGNLVVADFNGDGMDDLVANGSVLCSQGDGTFRLTQAGVGGVRAAADFNGDEKKDLLASFSPGGGPDIPPPEAPPAMVIWLGNGDGTFVLGQPVTTTVPGWGYAGSVADLNRDGHADVVLRDFGDLIVFLGNGDGTFGSPVQTTGVSWTSFPIADFNGDGVPDIATEDRILLGDGDGRFPQSVWYETQPDGQPVMASAFTRWPLAAADFDSDGNADLAMALEDMSFILVLPGKGDGQFQPPVQQFVGGVQPGSATTADLDGDGHTDLVTPNQYANSVSVLFSNAQEEPALQRAVSAASNTAIVAPESLATLVAPTPVAATLSAFPPWPCQLGRHQPASAGQRGNNAHGAAADGLPHADQLSGSR